MRARYRFGLGAPVAFELGPDAAESREWSVVVEREPDNVLTTSFFFVLARSSCPDHQGNQQIDAGAGL